MPKPEVLAKYYFRLDADHTYKPGIVFHDVFKKTGVEQRVEKCQEIEKDTIDKIVERELSANKNDIENSADQAAKFAEISLRNNKQPMKLIRDAETIQKRSELSEQAYERSLRRSLKKEMRYLEAQEQEKQYDSSIKFDRVPQRLVTNNDGVEEMKPCESESNFNSRMAYVKKLLLDTGGDKDALTKNHEVLTAFATIGLEARNAKEKTYLDVNQQDTLNHLTDTINQAHRDMLNKFQPDRLQEIIAAYENDPTDETLTKYSDEIHEFYDYAEAEQDIRNTYTQNSLSMPEDISTQMSAFREFTEQFRHMGQRLELVESPYYQHVDLDSPESVWSATVADPQLFTDSSITENHWLSAMPTSLEKEDRVPDAQKFLETAQKYARGNYKSYYENEFDAVCDIFNRMNVPMEKIMFTVDSDSVPKPEPQPLFQVASKELSSDEQADPNTWKRIKSNLKLNINYADLIVKQAQGKGITFTDADHPENAIYMEGNLDKKASLSKARKAMETLPAPVPAPGGWMKFWNIFGFYKKEINAYNQYVADLAQKLDETGIKPPDEDDEPDEMEDEEELEAEIEEKVAKKVEENKAELSQEGVVKAETFTMDTVWDKLGNCGKYLKEIHDLQAQIAEKLATGMKNNDKTHKLEKEDAKVLSRKLRNTKAFKTVYDEPFGIETRKNLSVDYMKPFLNPYEVKDENGNPTGEYLFDPKIADIEMVKRVTEDMEDHLGDVRDSLQMTAKKKPNAVYQEYLECYKEVKEKDLDVAKLSNHITKPKKKVQPKNNVPDDNSAVKQGKGPGLNHRPK